MTDNPNTDSLLPYPFTTICPTCKKKIGYFARTQDFNEAYALCIYGHNCPSTRINPKKKGQ